MTDPGQVTAATYMTSTVCHICANRSTAIAARFEQLWQSDPIEVDERKCRQCHVVRKFWWFITPRNRS